jgi:hypothetical protein
LLIGVRLLLLVDQYCCNGWISLVVAGGAGGGFITANNWSVQAAVVQAV